MENKDKVNNPSYYTRFPLVEVIDITENLNFNRGSAVKYLCRAGYKDGSSELEDLQKAGWYINREIERVEEEQYIERERIKDAERNKLNEDYIAQQPGEEIDWQALYKKRAIKVNDAYDYYRAGMTKTFDEVAFPDKCEECDGDCKVC